MTAHHNHHSQPRFRRGGSLLLHNITRVSTGRCTSRLTDALSLVIFLTSRAVSELALFSRLRKHRKLVFFFSFTREGLENRDSCIHPHSLMVGGLFFLRGRGEVGMDAGASLKLELAFDRSQMSNLLLLGSKSRQTKKKHTTPHKSIQLKIHL